MKWVGLGIVCIAVVAAIIGWRATENRGHVVCRGNGYYACRTVK